jgi:hypothetical protein
MAELVDAPDSKSGSSDGVWVRFPLPAPFSITSQVRNVERREMGLGACVRHSAKAAGESLALARDLAARQRALLASEPPLDPNRYSHAIKTV